MVDPEQELSPANLTRIAAFDVESIDGSLPMLLGCGFARALYRYLERSPHEIVFVERVDAELRARGCREYFVKTLDDPANRAVRFYQENGFDILGPRVEGGRTVVEFHKPLVAI